MRSVTYTVVDEAADVSGDYVVRDAGGNFTFDGEYQDGSATDLQANPVVTLTRGSSYIFNLNLRSTNAAGQTLGSLSFNVYQMTGGVYTEYNEGLTHLSKDATVSKSGSEAQGQFEGKVTLAVPTNAPSTLYLSLIHI